MICTYKYHKLIKEIYTYYNQNVSSLDFSYIENIYISNNIIEDIKQFYPDQYTSNDLGITIYPNCINSEIIILITEQSNSYDFTRILLHELTHMCDYINYANYYHNGLIGNFENDLLIHTHMLYSEFHSQTLDELTALTIYNKKQWLLDNSESLLKKYIIEKDLLVKSNQFSLRELFVLLGKIYMFDTLQNKKSIIESNIYKYLPLIIPSSYRNDCCHLYGILWDVLKNHSSSENLSQISNLLQDRLLNAPFLEGQHNPL